MDVADIKDSIRQRKEKKQRLLYTNRIIGSKIQNNRKEIKKMEEEILTLVNSLRNVYNHN